MGKLAVILFFILSVFPADANENRRHIHVVRRGSKKSHRGETVAKICIEENGQKKIEVAWSELDADDLANKGGHNMCKYKDTTLGIKKIDFSVKRGYMAFAVHGRSAAGNVLHPVLVLGGYPVRLSPDDRA